MDYTKYIQSINDDVNNQNNQKLLSGNPNYHIEKHISHFNYDDKTKTNVLSKLKSIIDSTTAMKVFNYLISNNLINDFLESYDYLTTLRIYNPLTYTQIINYVIDYKKTNTEMDDILEEEINFLLDTRVSKKSLQSLRNRTKNPNSVRILNKAIKNTPDKQSVKKMSIPVKQSLIEVLENLPTEDDFESKADEEEQIQSIANSVAETPDDFEKDYNDILEQIASPEKIKQPEEEITLPDLPDLDMEEAIETKEKEGDFDADEEEEEDLLEAFASPEKIKPFLSKEDDEELKAIRERARKNLKKEEEDEDERIRQRESNPISKEQYNIYSAKAEQAKKRKLEGEIEIEETEEQKEIKKKGGRPKGVPNRPPEVIAAEKAEKARKAEEREKLKKSKV